MKGFLILILTLIAVSAKPQQKVNLIERNSDYFGAILINDSVLECAKSPQGFGKTQEVQSNKNSVLYIEKEHNTVWYKLKIKNDCQMSFDLIPFSENDDYDFVVWKLDSTQKVFNPMITKPIRSNISRNDKSQKSKTGLRVGDFPEHVGQGVRSSYSKFIATKKGETYLILIDNRYDNGSGHQLQFHYTGCKVVMKEKTKFYISFILENKETSQPVDANIRLIKYQRGGQSDTLKEYVNGRKEFEVDSGASYMINISKDGFFKVNDDQKIFGREKVVELKYFLQPIEVGKKIVVEDIYFNGGSDEFLSKSYKSLKILAEVLKDNPTVKIEIQGHVNQPDNRPRSSTDEALHDLSVRRAKAVREYLIKRGIDESRLSYKGFGSTMMIYPKANNEMEEEKNRRVEILILSL